MVNLAKMLVNSIQKFRLLHDNILDETVSMSKTEVGKETIETLAVASFIHNLKPEFVNLSLQNKYTSMEKALKANSQFKKN